MKKFLIFSLMALFSLMASAQNTVYFGNIDKKTSVGLGINANSVTLSLMEISKSKNYKDFSLSFYNMNGEKMNVDLKKDTLYHLDLEKTFAHQQDYTMSMRDYQTLLRGMDSQSYVEINGKEYNGAAFAGVLRSLETEQNLFLKGNMPNIRNISLWSWQNNTMGMLRFRHPQLPKNRGFRYIRTTDNSKRPPIPQFPTNQQRK